MATRSPRGKVSAEEFLSRMPPERREDYLRRHPELGQAPAPAPPPRPRPAPRPERDEAAAREERVARTRVRETQPEGERAPATPDAGRRAAKEYLERKEAAKASSGRPRTAARRAGSAGRRQAARTASRAGRQLAAPTTAAARGGWDLAMQLGGATLGAIGLGLLLELASKKGALGGPLGAITSGLGKFLNPADPLFGKAATSSSGGTPNPGGVVQYPQPAGPPAPGASANPPGATEAFTPAAGLGSAPLPAPKANVIGTPFAGTHKPGATTPANWQSDNAVDLATNAGTPVLAVADGTVCAGCGFGSFNSASPYLQGQRLTLDTSGNAFYYAHLSRILVKPGQKVSAGQVLGYSGVANGVAHLHFAAENGDPLTLLGLS